MKSFNFVLVLLAFVFAIIHFVNGENVEGMLWIVFGNILLIREDLNEIKKI